MLSSDLFALLERSPLFLCEVPLQLKHSIRLSVLQGLKIQALVPQALMPYCSSKDQKLKPFASGFLRRLPLCLLTVSSPFFEEVVTQPDQVFLLRLQYLFLSSLMKGFL